MCGGLCRLKASAACFAIILSIPVIAFAVPSIGHENDQHFAHVMKSQPALGSEENYSVAIGDGHMHSLHSSGATSIHENSDVAKSRGLNWIFPTDHNVVPPQSECDAENSESFRCLVGEEVTTWDGHILGWGLKELVSWNLGPDRDMNDIFEDIHVQGGLAVLAHPMAPDAPDRYQYFGVYEDFDGLEVYHGYGGLNAAFPTTMDGDALTKWEEYLNAGIRKTAVGDSDCHDGNNVWNEGDLLNLQGAIGFPRNVLLVKEFSRQGILEAVSKGRLYVTDGPVLNFTIDGHILSETIRSSVPATLNVSVSGYANESSQVRLIRNGSVISSWSVGAGWFSVSESTLADSDFWYRTEIRTFNGGIFKGETYVAFTNPIFFDLEPYDLPPAPPKNLMAELSGNDVFLSWDPSTSADVDHYHIYVSNSYGNFSFLYPVARTAGTNWTHQGVGVGNNEDFFYIVRAVDKMGYEDNNTRKAAKTSRFLASGKHLISLPLVPANDSLHSILQTVSLDRVWAYESGRWAKFSSFKDYSDLSSMTHLGGYWLNVTQDSFFILAGAVPEETTIDVREGWNLVSFPSFLEMSVSDVMASLPLKRVEGPSGGPPHHLRRLTALDSLQPFQGYWFEVSANSTWIVPG